MATAVKTFRNYVGGEWVDAAAGETFESLVPATGELLGSFPRSTPEDVDRAVAAAKEACEDWRLVPAPRARRRSSSASPSCSSATRPS